MDLNITHENQGNRFITTATTTAIFPEAGNYTITCKEADQEIFARSVIVTINGRFSGG